MARIAALCSTIVKLVASPAAPIAAYCGYRPRPSPPTSTRPYERQPLLYIIIRSWGVLDIHSRPSGSYRNAQSRGELRRYRRPKTSACWRMWRCTR